MDPGTATLLLEDSRSLERSERSLKVSSKGWLRWFLGGNMGKTNGFWGASDVIFLLEQLQKMIHWLAKGELKNMWSDDPLDILGYPLVNIQKAIENGDL